MANIFDLFRKIESSSSSAAPITYVVAGLGNPGKDYVGTRHNVGFDMIDTLSAKLGVSVDRARFDALVCEATVAGVRVLLVKPQTFMNLSGKAIRAAMQFYKLPPENLIVFCDDISFDVGRARIRRKGSHGGHNGLRNIIAELGSEDFVRVKIGVGKKPRPDYDLIDWVLGHFPTAEKKTLAATYDELCEALELLVHGDVDGAMNKYSH
jgi:PTH1 family peptidyl-tRNA hydrolase